MKFPAPIIKGRLIKRYKRFLADIDLGGEIITAHCANPGSMTGLKQAGACVWVSPANNPKRKLKYDWQIVETGTAKVCINTAMANRVIAEALDHKLIAPLKAYEHIKPEQKYGVNSRIDFLLTAHNLADCYVEVKSVTLSETYGIASFPDSPTTRGQKHLAELANIAQGGQRAVMIYLVNRDDCERFTLAAHIDPAYAQGFTQARRAGVEAYAYAVNISPQGISLGREVEIMI